MFFILARSRVYLPNFSSGHCKLTTCYLKFPGDLGIVSAVKLPWLTSAPERWAVTASEGEEEISLYVFVFAFIFFNVMKLKLLELTVDILQKIELSRQ